MSELALAAPLGETRSLLSGVVQYRALWNVPVPLVVRVPLPGISLRRIRKLQVGDVLLSEAIASDEVALFAADVALSFGEFEVVDGTIGIRLTRLGQP